MLIDFCQFLYDSVEKVRFKTDFFFLHDRNAKANTSTQSEYSYIISHVQPKYTGNETSFITAALYSKCQPAKYLTVKQFKTSVKR